MKFIKFTYGHLNHKYIISLDSIASFKFMNDYQCDITLKDGTIFNCVSLKYDEWKIICG